MPLVQKLQRATVNAIGNADEVIQWTSGDDEGQHRRRGADTGRSRTVPRRWSSSMSARRITIEALGVAVREAGQEPRAVWDRPTAQAIPASAMEAIARLHGRHPRRRSRGHHPSGRRTKLRHRSVVHVRKHETEGGYGRPVFSICSFYSSCCSWPPWRTLIGCFFGGCHDERLGHLLKLCWQHAGQLAGANEHSQNPVLRRTAVHQAHRTKAKRSDVTIDPRIQACPGYESREQMAGRRKVGAKPLDRAGARSSLDPTLTSPVPASTALAGLSPVPIPICPVLVST